VSERGCFKRRTLDVHVGVPERAVLVELVDRHGVGDEAGGATPFAAHAATSRSACCRMSV
jgi:hypothetical protein